MSSSRLGIVVQDPRYAAPLPGSSTPSRIAQELMASQVVNLGIRHVRLEIHGTTDAELAINDAFITEIAPAYGLQVLVVVGFGILGGGRPHTLNDGPFHAHPAYGGGVNEAMETWLSSALLAADRWKDQVYAYEVLNEHNRLPPDAAAIDPVLYARLHTKFYRLLHSLRTAQGWPRCPLVVSGGLQPAGTWKFGEGRFVSDLSYLEQFYTSDPFVQFRAINGQFPIDAIGYHPYPVEIRASLGPAGKGLGDLVSIDRRMDELVELITRLDPGRPISITELGYNASYRQQTRAGQAQTLASWVPALLGRKEVQTVYWFKYEDFPGGQDWGLVQRPFDPDPTQPGGACYQCEGPTTFYGAYRTYQQVARSFEDPM